MSEDKKTLINHLIALIITLIGTGVGVHCGIKYGNQNNDKQDIETAIEYLKSASEEAAYQANVLDNMTGNLDNLNYKSHNDIARLESALFYFDYAGIVVPYPFFTEKVVEDHRVRSRLSPTGINSIYRVQEQLRDEKNYILGKETRQQEYMLATKEYPPNLEANQQALVVDVYVRKQALSQYKKHLNILSNLLQREIDYIQGDLTADEIRTIDHKEELQELTDAKKEIDFGFNKIKSIE